MGSLIQILNIHIGELKIYGVNNIYLSRLTTAKPLRRVLTTRTIMSRRSSGNIVLIVSAV